MALKLFSRAKGSNVEPNVATPAVVYSDAGWNRQVGPGGGYTWGDGPKMFVGPSGNPPTTVEIGKPGDFVEGAHDWERLPTDKGFPMASRWPGLPSSWEPPFYDSGRGATSGPGPNFMGGAMLESRAAIVFTCVDLISRTISSMNLIRTENSMPLPGLPWMDNPEPLIYSSMVDAMKALVNSLMMRGNAYVLATARYADGTVARWAVLNPDTMDYEIGTDGLPEWFLSGVHIPRSELLHVRYQTWPGMVRGASPLEAAWRSIASATAMEAWGTSLAMNNGIPTAVLSSQAKLTKDQATELKTSWIDASQSRGISPAILSGGLTYTPLNLRPAEIGLLDLRTFDEQRIASVFGVPLWLVGLPMNMGLTYSTAQATFDYFWRATLRSLAYNVASAFSAWALPRNQWVHLDNEALVEPDLPARAKAYKDLIDSGVIDAPEARIFENWPPKQGQSTNDVLAETTDGAP